MTVTGFTPVSAQGQTFTGLPTGLTSVKVKQTGIDPTGSSNKIDASTLDLATGSNRVYVDGLPDAGSGAVNGVTTTITAAFFAATPPTVGTQITYNSQHFKYTDVEVEYNVGDLVKGTATLVSVPS